MQSQSAPQRTTVIQPLGTPAPESEYEKNRAYYSGLAYEFVRSGRRDATEEQMVRLGAVLEATENFSGYTTPAEEFLLSVLDTYANRRGGLDPYSADTAWDEFVLHFDDMVSAARQVQRCHPALLKNNNNAEE